MVIQNDSWFIKLIWRYSSTYQSNQALHVLRILQWSNNSPPYSFRNKFRFMHETNLFKKRNNSMHVSINNESIISNESNAGIALVLVTTTFCVMLLDTAKNA